MNPRPFACDGLRQLAPAYDAVLCDLWGVVHDGIRPHAAAGQALAHFRAGGGRVVFVSNFPRPAPELATFLAAMGVRPDSFDAIVSSGDVTLELIRARGDRPLHHIGPERDAALFDGLDAVRRVSLAEASYVVCTGLVHLETQTPDDYAATLDEIARRQLEMVCANPDLTVHRGEARLWCAGALAAGLVARGGSVVHAGKPHAAIYERALSLLAPTPRARILAIGDAFATDVAGGVRAGLDTLLVTRGLHRERLHPAGAGLDPDALQALMHETGLRPTATLDALAW